MGGDACDPRRRMAHLDRQPWLSRPARVRVRAGREALNPAVGGHVRHAHRVEAKVAEAAAQAACGRCTIMPIPALCRMVGTSASNPGIDSAISMCRPGFPATTCTVM